MSYKSFEEMPLWQEAHKLAVKIHEITSSFPKHELYGLTSQLRRAAVSIAANVAEAFGRYVSVLKYSPLSTAVETACYLHEAALRRLGSFEIQPISANSRYKTSI